MNFYAKRGLKLPRYCYLRALLGEAGGRNFGRVNESALAPPPKSLSKGLIKGSTLATHQPDFKQREQFENGSVTIHGKKWRHCSCVRLRLKVLVTPRLCMEPCLSMLQQSFIFIQQVRGSKLLISH